MAIISIGDFNLNSIVFPPFLFYYSIGIRADVVVLLTQWVHRGEQACGWVILTGVEIIEVQTVGVLKLLANILVRLV